MRRVHGESMLANNPGRLCLLTGCGDAVALTEPRPGMLKTIRRGMSLVFATLAVCLGVQLSHAAAAPSPQAPRDVLFLFDTTGSMASALSSSSAQAQQVMGALRTSLGAAVSFGVAEVRDYPTIYGGPTDLPWHLVQPITSDTSLVQTAMSGLVATGGGDEPEAYGRALYEANHDAAVGWRSGVKRLVVVIADNVPHDDDLNGSLPVRLRRPGGWATGQDPGVDAAVGTADDLDWEKVVLPDLKAGGLRIAMVLIQNPIYLPHWQYWAGLTGGTAVDGHADVPAAIVRATRSAASGGFVSTIEGFVARSAKARRQLGAALSGVLSCSRTPASAARLVKRVIASRESMLRQLAVLDRPTAQAALIASLLTRSLEHSLAADRHYLAWLNSLPAVRIPCRTPHGRAYVAAQREDRLATAAKRTFASAFNTLARSLHLRTWTASQF